MKLFIRNLCIFLMGMSCWACSDNNNAETDDNGKGAYALFLKKSITVSAGENQTVLCSKGPVRHKENRPIG